MAFKPDTPVIVLIGHSGVGKSTLGPLLADALGYNFFDVDQEIADLPTVSGYNAKLRAQVIAELSSSGKVVIAAGCEDFSDEIMTPEYKSAVMSVWLNANVEGRPGRTVIVYTNFYRLSRPEQITLFGRADLTIPLESLGITEAAKLLIARVQNAIA